MGPNLLLPASASKSIRQGVALSQQLMITILDSFTAFLSPYSAYFGVLSNFLARFSRLALRLLPLAFFGRSASFFPVYFHTKPSLRERESQQFPPVDKALALLVLLRCGLIRIAKYWELLFNYNFTSLISRSKRVLQMTCLRDFISTTPSEALM